MYTERWFRGRVLRLLAVLALAHVALADNEQKYARSESNLDPQVRYVAVLFRHGARSPIRFFPTYQNAEQRWPDGFGQLTALGIRQHFELGRFVRQRYVKSGFLSPVFNHSELFVYTTDYERTFLSATAHMTGLFCPDGQECISAHAQNSLQTRPDEEVRRNQVEIGYVSLNKPPVPLHLFTNTTDCMLCPRMDDAYSDSKPNAVKLTDDVMKLVGEQTGHFANISDQLGSVADTLLCTRTHGYSLPSWLSDQVYKQIMSANGVQCDLAYTPMQMERTKLAVGAVINDILERFFASFATTPAFASLNAPSIVNKDTVQAQAGSGSRMTVYSMHDTQIVGALNALRHCRTEQPSFASMLLFELLQPANFDVTTVAVSQDNLIVRVWYVNEANGTRATERLPIEGCAEPCTLRKFAEFLESYRVRDLRTACLMGTSWLSYVPSDYITFLYAAIGLVVLLAGFACGIVCVVVAARCLPCVRSCMSRAARSASNEERGYRLLSVNDNDANLRTTNENEAMQVREVESQNDSAVL